MFTISNLDCNSSALSELTIGIQLKTINLLPVSRLIRSCILVYVCCYLTLSVNAQEREAGKTPAADSSILTPFTPSRLFDSKQLPAIYKPGSLNIKQLQQNLLPDLLPVQLDGDFFRFNNGNVLLTYGNQYAYTDAPLPGESGIINHSNAAMSLTLMGVPFSAGYNGALDAWNNSGDFSFASFKFDKENYLSRLNAKIRTIKNPEQFLGNALSQLYAKRDEVIGNIRNSIRDRLVQQAPAQVEELLNKMNADNLSAMEPSQILATALQGQGTLLTEKRQLLAELQNAGNASPFADSIASLNNEIRQITQFRESLEKNSNELTAMWQQTGLVQQLRGFEKEKQSLITALLQTPAVIANIAKNKFKLNGLQRFLLNAKSLSLGSTAISQSQFGMYNSLFKGASLEYVKNNKLIAPLLGKQPGIQNLADLAYSNFREIPDILSTALRFGKGDGNADFTHFSVMMFQQGNNSQFLSQAASFAGLPKNLVTSVSRKVSIGSSSSILTEVSKSTTIYRGAGSSIKDIAGTGNFLDNMGVNVQYMGNFAGIGLDESFTVRYTGKEYSNLGNAFMIGGSKEITNDLRKQFLKRKLQVSIRGQYREYELGLQNSKWQYFSFMADVKMRFRKGEFIELRYQPYFNRRVEAKSSYTSNQSDRLSVRGNISRRIARGMTYRNFIDLTFINDEHYNVFTDRPGSNRTFSLTSLQTLDVGARSVFMNLTLNRAENRSEYIFLNSSVSLDAGTSFFINRTISTSSSLVYSQIDQLYRQVAVRQSVSALLGRLSVNGYINAGKYFETNPAFLLPAVTGDISIQYNFK
jgi:predicted transcriptional regulator